MGSTKIYFETIGIIVKLSSPFTAKTKWTWQVGELPAGLIDQNDAVPGIKNY